MRSLYLPLAGGYRPCCVTKPFGLSFMLPDAGEARWQVFMHDALQASGTRTCDGLACLPPRTAGRGAQRAHSAVCSARQGVLFTPAHAMLHAADAMCTVMQEIAGTDFDQVRGLVPCAVCPPLRGLWKHVTAGASWRWESPITYSCSACPCTFRQL